MTAHIITADELEKFTTNNRREVLFYLHQLINDGERVSVIFAEGSETVLTVLLNVDEAEDMLIFDWGGSEESNRKLLQSERNYFVCAPHGVKNQFSTGPVYETTYQKRPAFSTRLPDHYTRLQRREFFRLVLPMTRRPPCVVRQEGKPVLNLSVVDISIGGIAAELPGGGLDIQLDQILPKARIDLKTIGTLEVDLQVRNRAEIQRGGKPVSRIGCNFVKLSNAMENQLQRFITDVQREERARLGS
ncbi:MAG: flagellar brake protein [Rhodocyclaceae bacterium]|nr:flagellar brake protein [Rhodocyclaceae bacterium]MDZ4213587.1 flagellar brake protein [Rhodocyclaceae bacterium]